MNEQEHRQPKTHQPQKENKQLEGKRIQHQVLCQQQPHKPKIKIQLQPKDSAQHQLFKDILSKRDRHKESHSKLEYRPVKKIAEETHLDKQNNKKEGSKSRSKSKGIVKSKSMKQLVKKSKSMLRLQPTKNLPKQERKSESPQMHAKSVISYADRKQFKSNFNSKTTREMISEQNTERQKSKSRLKIQKTGKKPTKVETIKKAINKSTKAKSEKQNKTEKRSKISKNKKQKKVLISQENSKVKREVQYWELSYNEDDFLDPKHKEAKSKTKHKDSNIVDIPKRKERLSFNTVPSRKPSLKHKTQAQLQSHRSQKKQLENHAAITIQKAFRGYLTRKYIKQCLLHNAAITIQKNWRGYMVRKMYKQAHSQYLPQASPKRIANQKSKIFQQQEYLMQKSLQKSQLRNSSIINEKWTSILEEILSEESVNYNIKKKIQTFLQSQRKELQQFNINQSRSPSVKSSISSQVITNEINSERHFFEQERIRKEKPHEPFFLNSPSNYISPRRMQYSSPQNMLGSPQSRIVSQSSPRSSSELLVANLKNIQKLHIDRLKNKAISEIQQLNKMLIKNKLSPRTHQKKYKEVEVNLESELQKFNESINQVVKNCIIYAEPEEIHENVLVTPKKEQLQSQLSAEQSPRPQQLSRPEQMSVEFRQYYQTQKSKEQQINHHQFQSFDTSYQFIEEYLVNLIDYLRYTDDGEHLTKVLTTIFKPSTLDTDIIMRNLKTMTQGSEDQERQNSFGMPLYKFIDLQEEIIDSDLMAKFNRTFNKLKYSQLGAKNQLQEIFLKMIVDCMNEAFNALRPQQFPFIQTKLATVNTVKSLKKVKLFEQETSQNQIHYQFLCAQALNKIFFWNKVEWGKIIKYQHQVENIDQTRNFLLRQQELSIKQLHANQEWNYYEELIETIGSTTQEIFEHLVFEEIAAIWSTIIEWNQKMGINGITIDPPNNKKFFQP